MKGPLVLLLALALPGLAQEPREPAQVVRVVDGDTIRVKLGSGQEVKVRLIGIDTPEVHKDEHLSRQATELGVSEDELEKVGEQATERATKLLSGQVWLEYDVDREDRYGRTLAYVWLDEQTMLNELLLDEGLAVPMAVKPNLKNQERFEQRAATAKAARIGVWALVAPSASPRVKVKPVVEEAEEELPTGLIFGALALLGLATGVCLLALRERKAPPKDDGPLI